MLSFNRKHQVLMFSCLSHLSVSFRFKTEMITYDKANFILKPKSTPFNISDDGDDDGQEEEEEDDGENQEEGGDELEEDDGDNDMVCYFFLSEFVLIKVLRYKLQLFMPKRPPKQYNDFCLRFPSSTTN